MKRFLFLMLFSTCFLAVAEDDGDRERLFLGDDFEIGEGEVVESLISIGSNGVIRGEVGTLVAIGSQIHLKSTAVIKEELVSIGTRLVEEEGSQVNVESMSIMAPDGGAWIAALVSAILGISVFSWPWKVAGSFIGLLPALGFGWLSIYLFPQFHQSAVTRMNERKLGMFGYGILACVLFVPVGVGLILTIVGIVLLPIYVMLFGALYYYGSLIAASFVGQWLPLQNRLVAFKALAVGLLLLAVVKLIPFLGSAIGIILVLMGFGSLVIGSFEHFRRRRATTV